MTNPLPRTIWIACRLEDILYGANTVVYTLTLIILLSKRQWSRYRNWKMVVVTTILYLLGTVHYWLELSATYLATFYGYHVLTQAPENIAADVCGSIAFFVGDLVLIHRLWILWGRKNLVAIPPLIAATLSLFSLWVAFYIWAHYAPNSSFPNEGSALAGVVGFVLDTCVSLFVTVLIVTRIWWMSRGMKTTVGGVTVVPLEQFRSVRFAIEVSIESGLLVALTQVAILVCYVLGSVGLPIVTYVGVQIYVFAPILVVLRVALNGPTGGTIQPHGITTIRFTSYEEEKESEVGGSRSTATT